MLLSYYVIMLLCYYDIALFEPGVEEPLGSGRLIVAPAQCYKQPELVSGKKMWGPSVQLYCVKCKHNWGVGDFSDLKYLIERVADRGADFVGLNPIHALYPNNADACSPYSPSSRRWLNVIFIDDIDLLVGDCGFDFDENLDLQTSSNDLCYVISRKKSLS